MSAGNSKRRPTDILPLRRDFAVQAWLADRSDSGASDLLFCLTRKNTAEMIRHDLKQAGIPYVDAAGRYADFHALRKTFITNLARAGVSPKAAQLLARHSDINLTMNTYTMLGVMDQVAAVEALPAVPGHDNRHRATA